MRRNWRADAKAYAAEERNDAERYETLVAPARDHITVTRTELESTKAELTRAIAERAEWLHQHPEAARRLARLDGELRMVGRTIGLAAEAMTEPEPPRHEQDLGLDLGR